MTHTLSNGPLKGGSWIILGATSVVARAFARQRAAEGVSLLILARDDAELSALQTDLVLRGAAKVETTIGDISSLEVQAEIARKAATLPGPVSLFSAIGLMPDHQEMLKEPELLASMMTANTTALMQMTNRLIPLFEDQQAGAIVLLGSVAGDRGRKKNFLYGASKAGLATYAQGLAAHLSAFHVPVLLVKPGVLDTAMTWGLKNPPLPLGQPEGLAHAISRRLAKSRNGSGGGSLYYPWFWFGIMTAIKHLPTKIFNKLNF